MHHSVLQELRFLEPIFHTPQFGKCHADYAQRMHPDYWEVGASGRIYTRDFILQHLEAHPPVHAESEGWATSGHAIQELASDTWLFTYTLQQAERITRRSTVWQRGPTGWVVLYHQGTVVAESDLRG